MFGDKYLCRQLPLYTFIKIHKGQFLLSFFIGLLCLSFSQIFFICFMGYIIDFITYYFASNSFTLNINNNRVVFGTNIIILCYVTVVTATLCLSSSIHTKRTATIIAFSNENEILNLLTLFSRIISLTPLLYSFFLFILCLFQCS